MPLDTPPIEAPAPAVDPNQLAAFTSDLCKRRDAAIAARKSSGIEEEWTEDEEYYEGIDDANRYLVTRGRQSSMAAQAKGQSRPDEKAAGGSRSKVFLNITRPYVDASEARLADMLLPVDDRCWAVKPTPIAELDDTIHAQLTAVGMTDEQITAMQQQVQAEDEVACELMQTQIDDHLVECNWPGEVRMCIADAAKVGSGVLKGPFPKKRTYQRWVAGSTAGPLPIRIWKLLQKVVASMLGLKPALSLETAEEIIPVSERIDYWNFYPDGACGENIHDGAETWERVYLTPRRLQAMIDMPQVDSAAIALILEQGPRPMSGARATDGQQKPSDGQYEGWVFYGSVSSKDAQAGGIELSDDTPKADVMAMLVNDRIIKLDLNAMETGDFPYDVLAWQGRVGMPWGTGVGRHIRTPQRMLNAASRAMLDNAGRIAGPQTVVGNGVTPEDGRYDNSGAKTWRADSETLDVRAAFFCYVPPSMIDEFMKIVRLALEMAEQTTGMPMLLQGQSPEGQGANTLGGMQLLQNNASGVLRRLAKRFDDFLTEPHIRRYYNWLMEHSDRDDIKGDFQVDVRASSALVERDSQKQFMYASMNFAKDPAFNIDPARLYAELCANERMDVKKIQYPEGEAPQQGGPSMLDQAKAELTKAQTVLAKVEAQFSAIQTANAVAANPAIAPPADATLASAGFQDADAPPIVGEPPPGTPVEPMPQSTHPAFPAKVPEPLNADVGAQAGIEGGQPR